MNVAPSISVIICCYNSSRRLSKTLMHLANQKVDTGTLWEVIVIDNASTDNTSELAKTEWDKYNNLVPLRVINQPIAGLSYARELGIIESSYEYLLFCDDDNWLSESYITTAVKLLRQNVSISVLGGCGIPRCEDVPEKWFSDYSGIYATGIQYKESNFLPHTMTLYGAGCIFSKTALCELKANGFKFLLSGRKGSQHSTGEDRELCYALTLLGHKLYYSDELRFEHFISRDRLTKSYRNKMLTGAIQANPILTGYHIKAINKYENRAQYKNDWKYIAVMKFIISSKTLLNEIKKNKRISMVMFFYHIREWAYFIKQHREYQMVLDSTNFNEIDDKSLCESGQASY